jgi:cobalt-zinc-cadmium efflux system outer membrane protein
MLGLRVGMTPAITIMLALTGCAGLSATHERRNLNSLVDARNGPGIVWPTASQSDAEAEQRVASLLNEPLSLDAAVQIALLRNPRMRIEYARLSVSEADVLDASRISNPTFSANALAPVAGNVSALITGGLSQSFSDLVLWGVRKRLAVGEYERAQLLIASSMLDVIADVRTAWYRTVGAEQVAAMRASVAEAARASSELAGQFHQAGNISVLQLSLEQAAATQARLAATRSRAEATRERATLSELLGVQGKDHWTIAERLATPVPQEDSPDTLLALAHAQRLDLIAAQREVSLLEESLSSTKRYRWMGSVDVGVAAERDTDRSRLLGPSLSLQLPIFNQGQGALARAHARLEEQRAQVQSLELNIQTNVRLGIQRIQAAREIAEDYRSALIPQRETVLERSQENINYMLIGAFELLLAKQQQYDATQGYLEAVRDYWLARIDLMRTVGARLPSESAVGAPTLGPEESPTSDTGEMHP